MDATRVKQDFPIFSKRPNLVYFDNACTTLKPKPVIDAVVSYYSDYTACAGRSAHSLAAEVDKKFEDARRKTAKFVNASPEELIWTRNTTEALNLVANTFDFSRRKKVVMTNLEHHSGILPFQKLQAEGKVKVEYVVAENGTIELDQWETSIDDETALVAVHHSNNSFGTRARLKEITRIARAHGAHVLIDGAQGVPHCPVDFRKEDYDFLAFSGHKMLGPTGIGALIVKKELLDGMPEFLVGGGTIQNVYLSGSEYLKDQHRFEAGIQHYAGAIGLGAAVDYLSKLGMKNVEEHEHKLAEKMYLELSAIPNLKILGPEFSKEHGALFSFNIEGAKPHEVALLLDKAGMAVRSGVFCAQPAMESVGAKDGAVRASLYVYNTEEDVAGFCEKVKAIAQLY